MAARVQLREITNEEGNRLLRIVHRDSGSVVTWRRAQIVLLSAQRMSHSQTSVLAEISRQIVRLYKEQFGCDPTGARTNFAGPDTVICTLEDTFTPAEHQRLRDTRLYFQHATEREFCAVIEGALDRKVRAFVSGARLLGAPRGGRAHLGQAP